MAAILLVLYFIIDTALFAKEGRPESPDAGQDGKLRLEGTFNLLLLAGVIGGVLMSGMWKPHAGVTIYHVHVELQNIARDVLLLVLAGVSLKTTAPENRRRNEFNWEPILEVAKLFAGIFISMIPAIAILRSGMDGALSSLIALVSTDGVANNSMYFWLTGALSSFLDNAPTYLVFFNTAGGDAQLTSWSMSRPCWPSRRARCSWAPTPTSAMRPTSWSGPSPNPAASRCPASSATWPGRAASWCPVSS